MSKNVVVLPLLFLLLARSAAAQPSAAPPLVLTLDGALQYAVEHYPAVQAGVEQVSAAAANVGVARASYLPHLDAVWQGQRGTANNVFGQVLPQSVIPAMSGPVLPDASAESVWGSAAGGLLSWEPFDLGLRAASLHEAEAATGRARADEALTRLTVQQAVASAFLTLLTAEQAVAAAAADVERRDVLARAAHVLADNQLRPGADASRADAERAAAETRRIEATRDREIARAVLGRILGVRNQQVSIDGARLIETIPAASNAAAGSETHPALRATLAAIDLARAREAVLQTTNRPRVLLQSALFARGTGANPDGTFDRGTNGLGLERANWAAGVQVVFPNLFEAVGLRARREAAAADTRIERLRHDESVLSVTADQQAADATVDAALAIARNTPVQLTAARQSESQARARYDAGLAGIVEVAESQGLLAAAEYQDALARVGVWRALLAQAASRGDLAPFIERVHAPGVQ